MSLFELVSVVSDDIRTAVKIGLAEHSTHQGVPPRVATPLAIVQRDDTRNIVAGLIGETFWTWLYVDMIWVKPDLRGQGIGQRLMREAEAEAHNRNCKGAYLWTQDFNAPTFYQKLGYQQFVTMSDFPVGHQRIGFMKQLAA